MIDLAIVIFLFSLASVPVYWLLRGLRADLLAEHSVAAITFAALLALSPPTALWLAGLCVLAPLAMAIGDRTERQGAVVVVVVIASVAALLASRQAGGYLWIGAAYFVLRHLHVMFDWWIGRLPAPGIARLVRYHFFLPLLISGPINRIQRFEREAARRHWNPGNFFSGAERALFGIVQVVFLAGWGMLRVDYAFQAAAADWTPFLRDWAESAIGWIALFLAFAGLNSVALGIALMLGLRLEENFDRPWKARNLLDFWSRWHMTLSGWGRDYIFKPVTALSRSPVLGVIATMLMIGVWHDVSAFYTLWGVWQAIGIIAMRALLPVYERVTERTIGARAEHIVSAIGGPAFVLAWLALSRPVIERILGSVAP